MNIEGLVAGIIVVFISGITGYTLGRLSRGAREKDKRNHPLL